MTVYNPDFWIVVKLTPVDVTYPPHYRVFANWAGSYIHGASWKLNSGITTVKEDGDYLEFSGSSGSVYRCHKNCYGTSAYGSGVLQHLIETSEAVTIEPLTADVDFLNMDYN